MAKGRIISNSISNSRKVNAVSDQAALLFTWIQAHTDDYGRIEGETQDVLFLIVPRRGWADNQVESYLKELWKIQLLKKYRDENGKRYFEVFDFEEHQTFRPDRNRKAKHPAPTSYDTQWDTNATQRVKPAKEAKLSQAKGKLSKVKVSVGAKTPPTAPEQKESEKVITPKEEALRFFEGIEALKKGEKVDWLQEFLNAIAQKNTAISKKAIWNEIQAFANYWTEPNGSGTKQKWALQQTFDVKRRLRTWFSRAFKQFSSSSFASSGRGKKIIGLSEDEENEQQP